MSIPVPVEELAETAARYGAAPFLLTTGEDARPRVTQVVVSVGPSSISCELGRRTALNGAARPLVSVLWPPVEQGGYSLIVDGEMAVVGTPGEDATGDIAVSSAVLHRPART